MKNRTICKMLLSTVVLGIATYATPIFAEENNNSAIDVINSISVDIASTNEIVVADSLTDEEIHIYFNDDMKSGTMVDGKGIIHEFYHDGLGNVLVDGEIVASMESVDYSPPSTSLQRDVNMATPLNLYGWIYVHTYRTTLSLKNSAESITLGLVSLVPYIGPFATIMSIVNTVKNFGLPEAYIVVHQYIRNDYRVYKNIMTFYRYSNYTGYLKTETTMGYTGW